MNKKTLAEMNAELRKKKLTILKVPGIGTLAKISARAKVATGVIRRKLEKQTGEAK
jgi:hypothetical protein